MRFLVRKSCSDFRDTIEFVLIRYARFGDFYGMAWKQNKECGQIGSKYADDVLNSEERNLVIDGKSTCCFLFFVFY